METNSQLTPRQVRFVREYLVDLNAHQAALRSGYAKSSARQWGSRLLDIPHVAEAIAAGVERRNQRMDIKADETLAELRRLTLSDFRRLFDGDGKLLHPSDLPDDVAACIASVEVVTRTLPAPAGQAAEVEYVHKIKFWDKGAALALAMRHQGLLNDKLKLQGDVDNPLSVLFGQIKGTGWRPGQQAED